MATVASQIEILRLSHRGQTISDNWGKVAAFLIMGYLTMGRAFAYLGLPWFSLYIGEMFLAAFLLIGPRTKQGLWLHIVGRVRRLRRFERLILLLLCYGVLEALHGILWGYPPFTAARDMAFNYYPLFIFLGIWVGLRNRSFLQRVVRALAWWNGCYGLAYVLFLNRLPWTMPGTANAASTVPVFSEPLGSAIALLGLLAFESKPQRVWYLLALNGIVMLFVQMRAEWVAFAVGLLVFAWCTKRIRYLAVAGVLLVALLGAMYMANVDLPSPKGRGGRISTDSLVARAVAPFSRDLASELAPSKAVIGYAGTAEWRLVWWTAIWGAVHVDATHALFGFGYGYPIGDLNPFIKAGDFIQTPHNDFLYALAFSGWIGVMLFGLLQIEVLRLVWRSYRITRKPFGLMCWAALLVVSMFGDFFEAPMGAIPFYLLVGVALAPSLLCTRSELARKAPLNLRPQAEMT